MTFPVKLAVTVFADSTLTEEILPATANADKVPTEVMLGCAEVVTCPEVVAGPKKVPIKYVAYAFCLAVILSAFISPLLTVKPPFIANEVPLYVILDAAPILPRLLNRICVFEPGAATVPEIVPPITLPIKLLAATLPVTFKLTKEPTLVMLG